MSARAWVIFAAVSIIWGIPYLFIKVAVDDGASPLVVAWGRVAIGAAILAPIAWKRGYFHQLRGRWAPLAAFAAVECAIPWWLIPVGEQHVSSSLAAILIAAMPLMIALLALRFDHTERVGGSRLAGLFIGLAGVVVLLGIDVAGRAEELFGAVCILGATLCYATGPLIVKRFFTDANPIGPVAAALGLSTVMLAPAAIAAAPNSTLTGDAVGSIAVLGVVCSALGLMLFFRLIAEVGASRASVITYINPAVAVALGVAVLGESVGAGAVAGLLLILAGSWLSTDGRLPPGLTAIWGQVRRPQRRRAAARLAVPRRGGAVTGPKPEASG